jgi:hypothetical protein
MKVKMDPIAIHKTLFHEPQNDLWVMSDPQHRHRAQRLEGGMEEPKQQPYARPQA